MADQPPDLHLIEVMWIACMLRERKETDRKLAIVQDTAHIEEQSLSRYAKATKEENVLTD